MADAGPPAIIVDPTEPNVAIVDGVLGFAVRTGPPSDHIPTEAEVATWPIIGYSVDGGTTVERHTRPA